MSFTEDEKRKLEFMIGKRLATMLFIVNELLEANRYAGSPSDVKAHGEAIALVKKELANIII